MGGPRGGRPWLWGGGRGEGDEGRIRATCLKGRAPGAVDQQPLHNCACRSPAHLMAGWRSGGISGDRRRRAFHSRQKVTKQAGCRLDRNAAVSVGTSAGTGMTRCASVAPRLLTACACACRLSRRLRANPARVQRRRGLRRLRPRRQRTRRRSKQRSRWQRRWRQSSKLSWRQLSV